ncbi:MAG TPA: AgmX/PglI C-terminal domain-containing protein [Polyangiaceae bacterium]|nr:AgmX/PglI C-terminal domain-containing protein [Polyangiaceae bacterium]
MKKFLMPLSLTLLAAATGCSFAARSPEMYRDDTSALLETKNAEIKACYDQQLQVNQAAAGTVRVTFMVQKDTGTIVDPQVDAAGTTAPAEVSTCVINSINGLQLAPPDQSDGQATYTWEFVTEAPPAAPVEAPPAG